MPTDMEGESAMPKRSIEQYDHKDKKRCNNPPVGLVDDKNDPDAGKKTYAFAGIARPETFRQTLETLGAAVIGFRAFPDHHPYTEEDLRTIQGEATAGQAACLVTTAKDAVRLERTRAIPRDLRVLEIAMSPAGNDGLSAWLRRQLASPDLSAGGRGRG